MAKRALDLILGTALALASLPVVALLAVLVAIDLRTSPFFTQPRVGRDQRVFKLVKIRTLPRSAPEFAEKSEVPSLVSTRLTSFLRRTHLDELPQLFLVPFGTMSLVGPRPEMQILHDTFDSEFARIRTSLSPGCTGLWQIGDAQACLIRDDERWDSAYVQAVSTRLDLWILWRSVLLVCGLSRPIAFESLPSWVLDPQNRTKAVTDPARVPGA